MTTAKKDIFDTAMLASQKAPLKHAEPTPEKLKPGRKKSLELENSRRKLIDIPADYFERFEELKRGGAYPQEFSAFIRDAIRDKLETLENGDA